jgi:hypothetical protein
MVLGFFLCSFSGVDPLIDPLQVCNTLYVCLHTGRAGLLHLVGYVAVHVQGKGCCGVSQIALHGLDIVPGSDGGNGEAVPLWHNKDKSENPCVATGWLVCPYSFSTKNGLQMGLTRGGEKLWLHLKDKFFRLKRRIKMGS